MYEIFAYEVWTYLVFSSKNWIRRITDVLYLNAEQKQKKDKL